MDRLIAPLALFVSFYLATLFIGLWSRFPWVQWTAFCAAAVATAATISFWNHGRWNLGLAAPPATAIRELAWGLGGAAALIGASDVLIVLLTGTRHAPGRGFPFFETIAVFLPAAVHEELVFRGYPYQVIRLWNRPAAIALSAVVFAALHGGNHAVTALALVNVGLGGVFLALAYERHQRLWLPIGLHFAWNLMSGPILGYGVSGYAAGKTLLLTIPSGPSFLTGGAFGIEGSALMTVVEIVAIAMIWRRVRVVEC